MPTLARQSSDYFFANRRKNYSPFVGKILFHLSRWGILKTVSASRWCLRCPHRLPQKLNLSQILSPACKMCIIIAVLHARFTSSIYRHQGAAYRRAGLPADRDQGYVAPGTGRTTRAGGSHHPHRARRAGTAIGTRREIKMTKHADDCAPIIGIFFSNHRKFSSPDAFPSYKLFPEEH